jgi:hypothetical protein
VFLRFVVSRFNASSGVREGLFPSAYALRREGLLPSHDREELDTLLTWFDDNLALPDRFNRTTSKGYYRRATAGIAWLKPTAVNHVEKMRALASLLGRNGCATEVIESDRPGYVTYEDDVQVIAEPFRDTPT